MSIKPGVVFADRFRIEEPIGSGGVGLVFRAYDLELEIPVAIKCLRAEWAEHLRIRRRFMREARAISRLSHNNIVRVFDYGEDGEGVPYIAMEYLDGTPLSELRAEPLAVPALLELADQVLAALAYVHARRIIHRDVKPENIIVVQDEDGATAKLLDFGFARVEEDVDAKLSQTKVETFGTPQYMAPEQATGKGAVGPPTDLYALGVVLYEFLAGRPPFTGAHGMAIALKHLMEPVPALEPRRGIDIPPGLEAVVLKCLQKDAADRFATAADMRRALMPLRGIEADEDVTLPGTALADAAAHIVRIAGDAALQARGEPSGLFNSVTLAAPLAAADETIRQAGDERSLVGREADLVEMWTRVRTICETGEGRAVLLGAEAGMGRRDVVEWVQEQVAEGGWMRVVSADAGPAARLGQGGLAALLEELFEGLPADREGARARIAQLLLRWSASTYEPSTSEAIASVLSAYLRPEQRAGDREAVIIRRACEAIRLAARDRPILLTLLSADQADLQTKTFLFHLTRSLDEAPFPLLAVLTYTDVGGAPSSEAQRLLSALERVGAPTVEIYQLGPLTPASTAALLRTVAEVDDPTADALARCARGNPLLARELLLYQQQEGRIVKKGRQWGLSEFADPDRWPRSLLEVFSLRAHLTAGGLPDPRCVKAVLDHSAVLGDAFEFGLLGDFLERVLGDPPRTERAIEALLKAELLTDARGTGGSARLRFSHPALRAALVDGPGSVQRDPRVHRAAAAALLSWYADDAKRFAVPIAEHFVAAGDPVSAGGYYAEAGTLAREEGRTADARAWLERAELLLGKGSGRKAARRRAALWLELCELELACGDDARAWTLAQRAARWAAEAGESPVAARASLLEGDVARRRNDVPQAVRSYGVAAGLFDHLGDGHGAARCLLGQAFAESSRRRFDEAGELFERARRQMETAGDTRGVARATRGCAEVALRRGDYLAAGRHLEVAREAFRVTHDARGAVACDWLLGETSRLLHLDERAFEHYAAARNGYRALGNVSGIARCDLHMARLDAAAGRWPEAVARFTQAARTYDEIGDAAGARATQLDWIAAALAQRAFQDALRPLRVRLNATIEARDRRGEAVARAQMAWAAGELGDAGACRAELRAAIALDRAHGVAEVALAEALEGLASVFRRYGHAHRAGPLEVRAKKIRMELRAPRG